MIKLNGITVDFGQFPNGETYIDLPETSYNTDENTVEMKFISDIDFIQLKFVKDSIDSKVGPFASSKLIMKYMPYSRMDRVENNRLFTLKSVADFINSLNFDQVEIWEPHSDVCVALLDRVKVVNKSAELALNTMMTALGLSGSLWLQERSQSNIGNDFCIEGLFMKAKHAGIYLVYPDAGAEKRYTKQIKYTNVLTATKHRDFNTGKITSIKINNAEEVVNGKTAIIVDDLCSKGGTFIGVAEELKKLGFQNIILVVTHCEKTIFDGKIFKTNLISRVVTTDSILDRYDAFDNETEESLRIVN
jgi:ribose-phosphate pyrophosphokinase